MNASRQTFIRILFLQNSESRSLTRNIGKIKVCIRICCITVLFDLIKNKRLMQLSRASASRIPAQSCIDSSGFETGCIAEELCFALVLSNPIQTLVTYKAGLAFHFSPVFFSSTIKTRMKAVVIYTNIVHSSFTN